jgi:hypothetical protein
LTIPRCCGKIWPRNRTPRETGSPEWEVESGKPADVFVHERARRGECQEVGCQLPATYCERHGPHAQQIQQTRVVIEEVIRELEFERQERWAPVIERLRGLL